MSGQIGSLEELAAFMKKKKIFFTEDGHPFVLRGGRPGVEYRAGSVIRFRAVSPEALVDWLNQREQPSRKAGWKEGLREAAEMSAGALGGATTMMAGARAVDAFVNPPKPPKRLRSFYPWNW
jgi:hypothetical protein